MKKILMMILLSPSAFAGSEQEALQKAAEAWAKHTGTDKRIERLIRDRIPKEYEPTLGYVGSMVSIVHEKKVVIKWEW